MLVKFNPGGTYFVKKYIIHILVSDYTMLLQVEVWQLKRKMAEDKAINTDDKETVADDKEINVDTSARDTDIVFDKETAITARDKAIIADRQISTLDERTITEIATKLRIIGDELNEEYTKLSFRNIFIWIRVLAVLRRIWI